MNAWCAPLRRLVLLCGLSWVGVGCGIGLRTVDPQEDGGSPVVDGHQLRDGAAPAPATPIDARFDLGIGASRTVSVGPLGADVDLGPALLDIHVDELDRKTRIVLTLVSLNGSPSDMRAGALGPVFRVDVGAPDAQLNGSEFKLTLSPEALGVAPDRLALGYLDDGSWLVVEHSGFRSEDGLVVGPVWSLSGSRIFAAVLRCSSEDDCRPDQRCNQACQAP